MILAEAEGFAKFLEIKFLDQWEFKYYGNESRRKVNQNLRFMVNPEEFGKVSPGKGNQENWKKVVDMFLD